MQISEYLYVPLLTWVIAQAAKFSIATLQGKYRPSLLFSSGGMPSVHSATVAALASVALIEGGPASPLFGITATFAAIVMYDALGVRRAAGEQAKTLNLLIDDLLQSGTLKTQSKYGHLREILGHRPLEVVIGAVLGFVLSCFLLYSTVLERAPWLLHVPGSIARLIELIVLITVVLGGVFSWGVLGHNKRWRIFRPFFTQILISNLVFAVALAVLLIFQQQGIATFDTWLFVVLASVVFVGWHLTLWYQLLVSGHLRIAVAPDSYAKARQEKWLKKTRKRSRVSR